MVGIFILTSQFFANVYLNELDQYVKHQLQAKQYVRYVDDFVILHPSPYILQQWRKRIDLFLSQHLNISLHQQKTRIIPLHQGINFLGMRLFPHHMLLRSKNIRKFDQKLREHISLYQSGAEEYDKIYDFLEGWCAYAKHANTYKLRKQVLMSIEELFTPEISTKEINRAKR